ncbi:MAG: nicotinate-nucleotide adenylyltransferase [bacterium]|nr:nicotinate-nucleotide adenylyltransferase [bacterium]
MKKVGIVGGTFNPIHIGHLMLAEWAADALGLEEVWILPAGIPNGKPDGSNILPGRERLHMTELAVQGNPRLRCLDLEVRREGRSYTCETVEELNRTFPGTKFYFVLGADCLFTLENWKSPDRILQGCTLAAAVRDGMPEEAMRKKREELLQKFGGEILLIPFVNMSLSSSEIRERVRTGKSIRYMVPEKVEAYLTERGFYRESI